MEEFQDLSYVHDIGSYRSDCGYCHSKTLSSSSFGMSAHSLTVDAYQGLIERGWRRSGCWLYRPLQHQSCCKTQTIRLEVSQFRPTKDQQRVRRRMERFLAGQLDLNPATPEPNYADAAPESNGHIMAPALPKPSRLAPDLPNGAHASPAGSCAERQSRGSSMSGKLDQNATSDAAASFAKWLGELLEADMAAGRLPGVSYPKASVRMPSAKQRSNMPEEPTLLTSFPLAVANVAGKGGQRSKHSHPVQPGSATVAAAQLSHSWAGSLQTRVDEAQSGHVCSGWRIVAHEGYILLLNPARRAMPTEKSTTTHTSSPPAQGSESMDVEVSCQPYTTSSAPAAQKSEPMDVETSCQPSMQAATPDHTRPDQSASPASSQTPQAQAAADLSQEDTLQHAPSDRSSVQSPLPSETSARKTDNGSGAADDTPASRLARAPVMMGRDGTPMHPAIAGIISGAITAADLQALIANPAAMPEPSSTTQRFAAGVQHRLKIVLRRSSPKLIDEEFPLYHRYQTQQHGDPPGKVSEQSFQRFLVDTPLQPVEPEDRPGACPASGLGSFHQQYWLDGHLVAVGVVDILPGYLSSKYFFWDPDLGPLALGKFSAMQEIEWVRSASAQCPSLQYYTMGFYIHSCSKMRYKGDYQPSELLSFDGSRWLSYQEGVQAAASLSAASSLRGSPASQQNGASPTSSEISGDSPRELTSPPSASSPQPQIDAALAQKVASTLVWLPLPHLQCRVQRFSTLPELLPDAPRWRTRLQGKLETWHGLLGGVGEKLVLLLLAIGTS